MRHFVLGTAGHVDHGKTTLVRALTGVDTDRLPEEKRRGITIELGFAPWSLGDGMEVSLIDVPGHRRLVHAMIAGAIGMEVVLLVVAADEGVMPQTREHVAACELLGLRRAVVAVTKLDRVGEELAQLAGEEALELLGGRFEAEVVVCSAKTGEGLEALRAAVRSALGALPARPPGARARLSVDRVFSIRGSGTVVTGTLVEGRIAAGAPLSLVGAGGAQATAARGLHVHDRAVEAAESPTRLAVNLAGLSLDAVHRGDVLTDDPAAAPTKALDVSLRSDAKLRRGTVASLYVGTARVTARIEPLRAAPAPESEAGEAGEAGEVGPGDAPGAAPPGRGEGGTILARLRLDQPMVVFGGDRFVLRGADLDGPAGAVLGGGVVLDARPPRRRPREPRRRVLEALVAGDRARTVRALVDEAAPRPLPRASLASRFVLGGKDLSDAADALVKRGELAALKAHGFASPAALAELAVTGRRLVASHHREAPLDRGLGLETLRRRLGELAGPEAAEEAIRLAASRSEAVARAELAMDDRALASAAGGEANAAAEAPAGPRAKGRPGAKAGKGPTAPLASASEPIVIEGDIARSQSFGLAGVGGAAGSALDTAARALREAGLKGVTELAVLEATRAAPREVKAILAKLVRDKAAVHAGELWFASASVADLRARVVAHLERAPKLTIAEFKELSGLGRKQAIVLLEHLDREGVTRRDGDDRLRGAAAT